MGQCAPQTHRRIGVASLPLAAFAAKPAPAVTVAALRRVMPILTAEVMALPIVIGRARTAPGGYVGILAEIPGHTPDRGRGRNRRSGRFLPVPLSRPLLLPEESATDRSTGR